MSPKRTRPQILLFDIDGTLISAHGVGRRALSRAFLQRFGVAGAVDSIELQGMTDPGIIRLALESLGREAVPELVAVIIEDYLVHLDEELRSGGKPEVLPGVDALLQSLREAPLGVERVIGLGTGNVEAGAHAKLRPTGLLPHFSFGGYGSDDEIRASLLRVGAERGAARLCVAREACRVIVVGDTVRDIDAARAIGAECLAVATGNDPSSKLRSSGATLTVEDLTCPQALEFFAN